MSAGDPRGSGEDDELTAEEAATVSELEAEIDAIDEERTASPRGRVHAHASGHVPPKVEIGRIIDGGLAPAIAAIVERGVIRRPHRANRLAMEIEIKVVGPYPATRVQFSPGLVLVEDSPAQAPMLKVEGTLPDLVSLLSAPIGFGGVPNPVTPRGRAALSKVATRKVRFDGPLTLRRELLALLRI